MLSNRFGAPENEAHAHSDGYTLFGHPSGQYRSDFVKTPTTHKRAAELWEEMPSNDSKVRELFIQLLSTGHVSEDVIKKEYSQKHIDILIDCIKFKWITNNCLEVTQDNNGLKIGSFGNPFSHY